MASRCVRVLVVLLAIALSILHFAVLLFAVGMPFSNL